jgi:hypothetical protein
MSFVLYTAPLTAARHALIQSRIIFGAAHNCPLEKQVIPMRPRASHILLMLDYALGAFFLMALTVLGVTFFAITGPIKQYEWQALGGVYTDFLSQVEGSARDLRSDFCARADEEAASAAKCASGDAASEAVP